MIAEKPEILLFLANRERPDWGANIITSRSLIKPGKSF
jgi:hypothetical protein